MRFQVVVVRTCRLPLAKYRQTPFIRPAVRLMCARSTANLPDAVDEHTVSFTMWQDSIRTGGWLGKRPLQLAVMDPLALSERLDSLIAQGEAIPPLPPAEQWVSGPKRYAHDDFSQWRVQSLTFLRNNLPSAHSYVVEFERGVREPEHEQLLSGLGMLRGLRAEFAAGLLSGLQEHVTSEILSDFLAIAGQVASQGHRSAAASLAGAVLQHALSHELRRRSIAEGDDLPQMNELCAEHNVYSRLAFRQVEAWIDIRNHAARGEWERVSHEQVAAMLDDLPRFLRSDLGMP